MRRIPHLLGTVFLGVALLAPVIMTGCEGRVTVYDRWHGDRHHWDDREEVVYRGYLTENHREYREYKRLNRDQQKEYWNWRHNH